jgi:hypothetical protein
MSCAVNSTSDYTLLTLYHYYYESISANIQQRARHTITEAKQHWSVIGDQKICYLSLVPAVFAGFSTHQSALGARGGLWPVLLLCNP